MWPVDLRIFDEETAAAFAEPLDDAIIAGATEESFDAIEWIGGAAPGLFLGFGPFIDERKGDPEVRGHLFGTALFDYFPQQLVGFHSSGMMVKN
jgi:hypothetical protein